MGGHQYYMLMASLPALPRFDRAERLPINRERLSSRHTMLLPEDAELVERATGSLAWFRQPATRSDEEVIANYEHAARMMEQRGLWHLFELHVNLRTIMAALRRRHGGGAAPKSGEPWGMGPLVRHIERHWDDPDFKLSGVYPWIPQVRAYLEEGAALDLERFVMGLVWDRFDHQVQDKPFGFEAFVVYLVKWGILQQWLTYDKENAQKRFEELVAEVTDEWEELFDGI
jgi:hypothetical protein